MAWPQGHGLRAMKSQTVFSSLLLLPLLMKGLRLLRLAFAILPKSYLLLFPGLALFKVIFKGGMSLSLSYVLKPEKRHRLAQCASRVYPYSC